MIHFVVGKLRAWFRKSEEDAMFREELQTHLEMMIEERMARGLSAEEARLEAVLQLGGVSQLEEAHREWRGIPLLENFVADIRFGWRDLCRNRRFALTAILTTGLAVGLSAAVFSMVDRALIRPLAYGDDIRLMIGLDAPLISSKPWLFSGTFQEWAKSLPPIVEAWSAWKSATECDWNRGTPERGTCALGDHHLFATLQLSPAFGRSFTVEEDSYGATPVALISYGLWQSHFATNPSILGRTVSLNGKSTEIIGVLPTGFEMPDGARPSFLLPMRLRVGGERQRIVQVVARVHAGVESETVQKHFEPLFQRLLESVPSDLRKAISAKFYAANVRDYRTSSYRSGLLLLLGAVVSFLLLASTNVASLLLARAEARRHEFAIRSAIGATGGRLARQSLAESLLLGGLSSGLGVLVAWITLGAFQKLAPAASLRVDDLVMDYRVLASAVLLSFFVALLFGSIPALEVLRFKRDTKRASHPVRGQRYEQPWWFPS
jgi:putative ABC transport system permease protein